jgi:hypothetical protein
VAPPAVSGRKVIKALTKAGFKVAGKRGSQAYAFEYSPEPSTRGIVHGPVAYVHLQSKDGKWCLFCPYVDSGADMSLFPEGAG